ncbi:hypothetical protein ACSBR2_010200 [Camellia fascicularis]
MPNFGLTPNNIPTFQFSRSTNPLFHLQITPQGQEFNSQSTCFSSNSTSDEADEQQLSLINERKQRRMISNRESARRSRMRKQKHLDELWSQVLWLRNENHQLIDKLNHASESHDKILQENTQLKEETSELRQMLTDMQLNSDSWVKQPGGVREMGLFISRPMVVANRGMAAGVQAVHTAMEGEWFQLLDRALVGQLRGVDGKGLSFAAMSDWPKALLHRRWTLDGHDLLFEWWTPLALCASRTNSTPGLRVWIRETSLPLHLRGEEVYRVIGDQCGGFVEADEVYLNKLNSKSKGLFGLHKLDLS